MISPKSTTDAQSGDTLRAESSAYSAIPAAPSPAAAISQIVPDAVQCAGCGAYKHDAGDWRTARPQHLPANTLFSHGLCPKCCAQHRSVVSDDRRARLAALLSHNAAVNKDTIDTLRAIITAQAQLGYPDVATIEETTHKLYGQAQDHQQTLQSILFSLMSLPTQ
jgi:hypothetical protein